MRSLFIPSDGTTTRLEQAPVESIVQAIELSNT